MSQCDQNVILSHHGNRKLYKNRHMYNITEGEEGKQSIVNHKTNLFVGKLCNQNISSSGFYCKAMWFCRSYIASIWNVNSVSAMCNNSRLRCIVASRIISKSVSLKLGCETIVISPFCCFVVVIIN